MTRRDLQGEAKKLGRSWEAGKAFEHSAPCTGVLPVETCGLLTKGAVWLDVNGIRRQAGDLAQMIWDVPDLIAILSSFSSSRLATSSSPARHPASAPSTAAMS